MEKIVKTDAEWRAQLTPEQYRITRAHGTEPGSSAVVSGITTRRGLPPASAVTLPLFASDSKFDSGTWLAQLLPPHRRRSSRCTRTTASACAEPRCFCARCDAHLGRVFPDGPKPTGLRYCITPRHCSSWNQPPGGWQLATSRREAVRLVAARPKRCGRRRLRRASADQCASRVPHAPRPRRWRRRAGGCRACGGIASGSVRPRFSVRRQRRRKASFMVFVVRLQRFTREAMPRNGQADARATPACQPRNI